MLYKNLPSSKRNKIVRRRMFIDNLSAFVYLVTGRRKFWKSVRDAHSEFGKMKENLEVSPFSEEYNDKGLYHGKIVLDFYISGKKLVFDKLRF
jgi:hypothetical protein